MTADATATRPLLAPGEASAANATASAHPTGPALPAAPAGSDAPAGSVAPEDGTAPAGSVAATGSDASEPDTLATLVDEIGWALARRRAALTRRLGRRGVTGSQTMLLFHLRMRGDLPMSRLADLLGIGLPNLTGIVDRMEEHGLVARRRVPDDRRLVIVALTDEGRRIPEEIEGVQRELLEATFATLDDDRLRGCLTALRDATSRTDDQDIGPGCTRRDASHDTTC